MLKQPITYTNFLDEEVTETFYFNLTRQELLDLMIDAPDAEGFEGYIRRLMDSRDAKEILGVFRKIVLAAYGVRSEDGKRFIKNDQLREEFSQHAAYDELLFQFFTHPDKAAIFVRGLLPKDLDLPTPNAPKLPPPPAVG